MAYNNINVLLGYEDEIIADKYKGQVNFTTNKIGGKPDWPTTVNPEATPCPLCQLPRLLVVQIYAPLENSTYHRTLYVFACINPNCWNQSESWTCVRTQTLEQVNPANDSNYASARSVTSMTAWCQDADDWDDENNANLGEENGNLINNAAERVSDEDDESISFEETVRAGFENLNVDDRNANNGSLAEAQGGAVGSLHSPTATAEIEGDEGEIISIDTPTFPQKDISAILQEVAPLPQELCQIENRCNIQFISYFVSVTDETTKTTNISDRHVRELLQEYQINNEDGCNFMNPNDPSQDGICGGDATLEKYEKGKPAHGDEMFHHFLSKIQKNPGQILRYGRGITPLLLGPLKDIPRQCRDCQSEMVFEFQILPTLIPRLQIQTESKEQKSGTRLEYGNVLIFTCRKSCWSMDISPKHESIIVQAETY